MSTENLYQVFPEVSKNDFIVEEKKIYNEFYKLFTIDAPVSSLPLEIPHGINEIKLLENDYRIVVNLLIDNKKVLHNGFNNFTLNIDENNINFSTTETGQRIKGQIRLHYKKENSFETARTVKVIYKTVEQNFPQTS